MIFTYFLNKDATKPLYVQLYDYIKTEIESGRIHAGEKLPSIRFLSKELHVSKQTIENAYQQLASEGYVESRPKSGFIVLPIEEQAVAQAHISPEDSPRPEAAPKFEYDFKYGDIELELFPKKIWKQCINAAMDGAAEDILLYGPHQGSAELREEIRKYVRKARGISCSTEQIFIFGGTQQSIGFLSRLLNLRGENVAMENPGYEGVRSVFLDEGSHIIPISLEKDGICTYKLEDVSARALYVTPSHQFPMGMVLSVGKRNQLLHWANEANSYIIEDDYDGEFRYIGKPIPSLKSLDKEERVVYCGTFSKCFLPAARISYVILPPSLVENGIQGIKAYSQSASPILQKALAIFIKEGYFERHIRRMRTVYQQKHQVLLQAIDEFMGDHVKVIGQRAGLHLLIMLRNGNAGNLINIASEHRIHVYSPAKNWLKQDQAPDCYVMLGFGGLTKEKIHKGIKQLAIIWKFLI
nr:PLP-dependent aminotransferase family protein [Bacillus sp. M6-12]